MYDFYGSSKLRDKSSFSTDLATLYRYLLINTILEGQAEVFIIQVVNPHLRGN